ncbi:hypothetical protein LLG96_11530 [bacterium]|nr:hypothetical protein [bacterium]
MRKNVSFAGVLLVVLVMCVFTAVPGTVYPAENDTFTDADAQKLKGDNPDAVAEVLYKLSDMYEAKGKAALKPAVPALIEAAKKELKLAEDQRWNIVDIIKVLSMTGDERTKPMLLTIMSVMWGGGNPFVAQGLLAIGPSVIPAVVDSLKSASADTRGRAALTLHKMSQLDESGKIFAQKDRDMIRDRLKANLTDKDVNVRIYTVVAMRSFGDASVIPVLENIEKTDAHKDSGGTYEVRLEATETLKVLKGETKSK